MPKKKKILKRIVSVILFIFLISFIICDLTFYNHFKDNIFEIPKSHHIWGDKDEGYLYETYFLIQKVPESQEELEKEVRSFISENKIIEDAKNAGTNTVSLNFMIADFRMPIFFTEDSKRDKYSEHNIKTHMTARYLYDIDNEAEKLEFYQVKRSF
ncbi:MAG: hypothetical protein K6F71_06915 [Ruminococcus sp.]|uniref:hypothetical protein n=1 Tax=Ruminococcus sp. TaxID=41978 RepID=UPI0025CC3156|nr:hypothetical protein [Ruminococcus sp.]MCR5540532.1 hypothetical protein [Ruminococcus sp.]